MSFKLNQSQQLTLEDSFLNLSPRTQKIVMNSWAKDFADIVFPAINEERFSVLYSDRKLSRANTPVNVIIGALILKENLGLTEDELFESICCDIRFQYALHTTHLKDQPISDRTFSRFRERLYNYERATQIDLLKEEMQSLNDTYARFMKLNSSIKRMDSLMVASNCKHMSRLEIIYTTVHNAIRYLQMQDAADRIPEELKHYIDPDDLNKVIYYCKSDDVDSRLDKVIREATIVRDILDTESWRDSSEFQLLLRVLDEQTQIDEKGNIRPKDKADISSSSLQNPSDPDATFRRKAGKSNKGYVGNLIETVGEEGDSLITDIQYEKNTHSDSAFCEEYLSNREDDSPNEIMITDGAYNSTDNQKLAEVKNVKLVSTALTGQTPNPIFSRFILSDDGTKVLSCPMGHTPEKCTYYPKTGICRAQFSRCHCENCPHREECKGKPQRKTYAVHISSKMVSRAAYAEKLSTEEYRTLSRMRNAIEGIPSVLRRKFRVDEIPVFGLIRSKMFFTTKIMAYNFGKLMRSMAKQRANSAQMAATT